MNVENNNKFRIFSFSILFILYSQYFSAIAINIKIILIIKAQFKKMKPNIYTPNGAMKTTNIQISL